MAPLRWDRSCYLNKYFCKFLIYFSKFFRPLLVWNRVGIHLRRGNKTIDWVCHQNIEFLYLVLPEYNSFASITWSWQFWEDKTNHEGLVTMIMILFSIIVIMLLMKAWSQWSWLYSPSSSSYCHDHILSPPPSPSSSWYYGDQYLFNDDLYKISNHPIMTTRIRHPIVQSWWPI